jgi:hypothetical protein
MTDNVNHPAHYTSGDAKCKHCGEPIECMDIAKHWSFPLGNVLKYLWRCDYKGKKIEDLEKAEVYLNEEIKLERMRLQHKGE